MSQSGVITKWLTDKGYGFVQKHNGRQDIFLHYTAFLDYGVQPAAGDVVWFDVNTDPQTGRPRAVNAVLEESQGYGHKGNRGSRYNSYEQDGHLSGYKEEHVLIDFGKLLEEGNPAAKKVHEKYNKDSDYEQFLAGAQKVLRGQGGAPPSKKGGKKGAFAEEDDYAGDGSHGLKGKKKEEKLLIDFGVKLQAGDAAAQKVHKAYEEDKDYDKFLLAIEDLIG